SRSSDVVVGLHRLHQHQVGVGVETPGERVRMVVEIAGHLVAAVPAQWVLAVLGTVGEPALQLLGGAIGGVGDTAGRPEPLPGASTGGMVVVVAAMEGGIGTDRGELGGVSGELIGAGERG